MIFKRMVVGPIEVNCYILADDVTKAGIVVDPGDNVDEILEFVRKNNIIVKYIVNTHCHFDHAGGNKKLKDETGAQILIHENELPVLERMADSAKGWGFAIDPSPDPDKLLKEGDIIKIGDIDVDILHTPGHSPGGICLKFDNKVLSGDTLFAGGIGRTDFPGGSHDQLLKSIREKLFTLSPDLQVYPGHGPSSSIQNEKVHNPFF
jgi:hydroxyacylglutathione hydrolase